MEVDEKFNWGKRLSEQGARHVYGKRYWIQSGDPGVIICDLQSSKVRRFMDFNQCLEEFERLEAEEASGAA